MDKEQVKNKYDLTLSKIRALKVADRSKVCEPLFSRYGSSWQIWGSAGDRDDFLYETYDNYDIRIYDEDAPEHAGELVVDVRTLGGASGYVFEAFFDGVIGNHREIQEELLEKINLLIDEGVLVQEDAPATSENKADVSVASAVARAREYIFGQGAKKDEKKGFEILRQYEDTENPKVHGLLGMIYYNGLAGLEPDYAKALEHLLLASRKGGRESMRTAGFLLMGVADESLQDYPEAIKWLSRAADDGEAQAMIYLARVYAAEDYEGKDIEKAAFYMEQAEKKMAEDEQNGEQASFAGGMHRQLADLYYSLYDEEEKLKLAFDHYCRAYSGGEEYVIYDVGWMYFVEGFESELLSLGQDELLERLRREEEESDDPEPALLLGRIYDEGLRVEADAEEAIRWYRKAYEKGADEIGQRLAECCGECGYEEEQRALLEELYGEEDLAFLDMEAEAYD